MKILMVVAGFGPPDLQKKIGYLEHNLELINGTRGEAEVEVEVYSYADEDVEIKSPFGIKIIKEKGIIGQFLYRHVKPDRMSSYDFVIISMDDIWLNDEFNLSRYIQEKSFRWDIISPCLEDGTLHRHKHMLKNGRTGMIFHEGLELFLYIMPRNSYIHYWNVFVDEDAVWLWAVDYILGRKGFIPYMDCSTTMKHLHLGSSMNKDAYAEAYRNEARYLVPQSIIQIWIGSSPVPPSTLAFRESWKNHNTNYQYVMIENPTAVELVAEFFPELLTRYNNYPRDIMRSDVLRYMCLYKFGGIYADNDFKCLKSFDNIILYMQQTTATDMGLDIMFGQLPGAPEAFLHSIPNALIVSKKGQPFWRFVLDVIGGFPSENTTGIPLEMEVGSALLYTCIEYYTRGNNISPSLYGRDIFENITLSGKRSRIGYANPNIFYAVNWHNGGDPNVDLSESFAVTYWNHGSVV
jgi:hypothetical protein